MFITSLKRSTAIVLTTAATAGGLGLATPAVSQAADASSGSSLPAGWLCYSRLAGYKIFQYSNCSGWSYSIKR